MIEINQRLPDGFRERAGAAQRPARAPYLPPRRHAGGFQLSKGSQKSGLSSPPPFGARLQLGATQSASLGRVAFCGPDTRGEARRRRQARSAHAIEAERGARRPRWRPPEAARDLRPHGVLRRRLVAGEVCRLQALPWSPHSSTLCFLRLRLVGLASTRSWHCQVPVGSTAPLLVDRSQDRVRPRPARRAHAHTARSHMAYAQLNVSRCHRAYVLSS